MCLELLLINILLYYLTSINLLMLLYTGGLYLILLGLILFINDFDIFVGFLWVIDFGVGLVFFIFILHFSSFLYQKSNLNLYNRFFFYIFNFYTTILFIFYYLPFKTDNYYYNDLLKTWFWRLTYNDYYYIYNTYEVTELNLIRDLYFIVNSFEFFIVNFSLLFGLLSSILMCFMVQRIFNFLNFSQIISNNTLSNIDFNFFIKSQNFILQHNTPGIVRVWSRL